MSRARQSYFLSCATEIAVIAVAFAGLFLWKSPFIDGRVVPVWDSGVYLTLAHDLLTGQPLYEWFRPMLLPSIVAGIWSVTGENYLFVRYFNLAFTLASAGVLYFAVRVEKGRLAAFASVMIYVTAFEVLVWTDYVLVEGLTTLFSLMALVAFRKYSTSSWIVGGGLTALAVLARYTSVAVVVPIILAYALDHRKIRLIGAAVAGSALPLFAYQIAFPFAIPNFLSIWLRFGQNTGTAGPWSYYLVNWYVFFGLIGIFALVALVLPSTYKSISSRPWALWLVGSLLFFTITTNKDARYTFEWTPAVAFLSIVGFQAISSRITRTVSVAPTGELIGSRVRRVRVLLGVLFTCLLALQVFTSVVAYLPIQKAMANHRDNNLIMVAEYVEQNTAPDSRFISDHLAPLLTYFTDRHFSGVWRKTSEDGFLNYLHGYFEIDHANYLIIFPKVSGNSPTVLQNCGFLTLVTVIDANSLGKVYIFRYSSSP